MFCVPSWKCKKKKKSLFLAGLAVISMNVLGMNPFENNNRNGNNPWHTLTQNSSPRNNSNLIESIRESVQNFSNGNLSRNETNKLVNMMHTQLCATSTKIQESVQNFHNGDLTEKETNELVNMMYTQISASEKNQQVSTHISELKQHIANLEEQNAQIIAEKDARISELNERIDQFQFENQQLRLNNQNLKDSLTSIIQILCSGMGQVFRQGSLHIPESALQKFAINSYNSSNKIGATISELSDENTMENSFVLESPSLDLQSSEKRPAPEATISQTPTNQQAISTEKLIEKLKLPEYPEGYEEGFFDAIERDLNIDKATAKEIIADWRRLELEAFRSVSGLTEEKLDEWRSSSKKLVKRTDEIFGKLITKIKEKKESCVASMEDYISKTYAV